MAIFLKTFTLAKRFKGSRQMTTEEVAGWMFIIVIYAAILLAAFVVLLISAAVLGFVGYWVCIAAVGGFKAAEHQMCRWTGTKSPFD